ncbi:MAG: dihydrolipoyl dehydrogenase [Leptospiraceae bacterium]|nr:dihydrolipoyl dehydrogenase [Leptospiraceae bacterium]MCP5499105.1 dihydrolipoyl dehydrogenase [Leptospiraceae bacterium]
MSEIYEVVVIGGGPGGYVAAIRASQLGFKTAVIERDKLGGICLNWGCIPTKALLQSAHLLEEMKRSKEFGILSENPRPDFPEIIQRSRNVAAQMSKGVSFLMKKNKIDVIEGNAKFKNRNTMILEKEGKYSEVQSKYFILATGARAKEFPGVPFDNHRVISSKEAMQLKEIPQKLAVIGAGAIGVEFSDFYASMGSDVTLIEFLPSILPNEDAEISKILDRSLKKRKITVKTSTAVKSFFLKDNSVTLQMENLQKKDSQLETLDFDKVLVGIGLQANTENLQLEELGIVLEKSFIQVNSKYNTAVENIYAIGDCIGPPLLAHVASFEGIRAAEAIGIKENRFPEKDYETINYEMIPACTYCHPEVASVGLSEEKVKKAGIEYNVGKFPFSASGRAQAMGDTTGMIKIISEKKYGEIIGAHIIGPNASELIPEIVLGGSYELTTKNIANTIHAHPSLAEGVMEAAAAAFGEAINI